MIAFEIKIHLDGPIVVSLDPSNLVRFASNGYSFNQVRKYVTPREETYRNNYLKCSWIVQEKSIKWNDRIHRVKVTALSINIAETVLTL